MLRIRELAATGMERSPVKAGMTGDRACRPDMETGHGDRERRQDMETGMETGNGDKESVESQEVSGRSLPLKCSNVRSVSR